MFTLQSVLAAVHLLAFGIGLGAIVARALLLRGPVTNERLPAVFLADTLWGIASLLWISTGLWRAFWGVEKGALYYLGSDAFRLKMGLLAAVLILEIRPMITLIRWRVARGRGKEVPLDAAPILARLSAIQAALIIAMVFVATAMARGLGY